MQFEYDPQRLIEEVKKRPGIWDYQDPEYRAKNTRFKLWNEIVSELMQPDVKISKSEMRELEIQLQKKWKSIRDCFQKYITNPTRTKKPYVYCRQLQFLLKDQEFPRKDGDESDSDDSKPLRKRQHTWRSKKQLRLINNEETSEEDAGNTYNDTQEDSRDYSVSNDEVDTGRTANIGKLNKTQADDTTFAFANVDAFPSSSQISGDVNDPDRLFLLSLLPHLKSIPEEYRLNVKMDLMQVLRNANYGVVHEHKIM